MTPIPPLRPEIDAMPSEQDGKPMFIMHDRSGESPAQVAASPGVVFVAGLFDGKLSIPEVQALFKERTQEELDTDSLVAILKRLEEARFLDSAEYRAYHAKLMAEFAAAPVRAATCADTTYPEDPTDLATSIDEILEKAPSASAAASGDGCCCGQGHGDMEAADSPESDGQKAEPSAKACTCGKHEGACECGKNKKDKAEKKHKHHGHDEEGGSCGKCGHHHGDCHEKHHKHKHHHDKDHEHAHEHKKGADLAFEKGVHSFSVNTLPIGAIGPHIDYGRGWQAYGQLFNELANCPPPEVVVILGTSHQGSRKPFAFTRKDFATPLGVLRNAVEITSSLAEAAGGFDQREEFLHRAEHSIELQLPFIQHIWGNEVRVVPVLCGNIGDAIESKIDHSYAAQIEGFCNRLRELMATQGEKMLVLASADLSHIGPNFGDERIVDEEFLDEVARVDSNYLRPVLQGSCAGALSALRSNKDETHICGSACINALLMALGRGRGRLLGYHQASNEDGSQAVSFASVIFDR